MKALMRSNIIERYERALPGEIEATEDGDELVAFLESIEGKEIDLIFTGKDAFEKNDNNIWLPDVLWDKI